MAALAPSKKRKRQELKTEQVDLTPIMNLFLVIIPMLISMIASVTFSIAALTLPTGSSDPEKAKTAQDEKDNEPKDEILIGVLTDKLQIKVNEKMYNEFVYEERDGKFNHRLSDLDSALVNLSKAYPDLKAISVAPSGSVKYESFIRVVDICKKDGKYPQVKYSAKNTKVIYK